MNILNANQSWFGRLAWTAAVVLALGTAGLAQGDDAKTPERSAVERRFEALDHRLDVLEKAVDDLLWFQRVGDVALVDKLFIVGPPPAQVKNPTAMGAQNPLKFWTYLFVPKWAAGAGKLPLIVLPHGGVHANFTTYHTHIVRELVAQGYVVAAPEYRGSTGYGKGFYERIDYGGRENDDVHATRLYVAENCPAVDGKRAGIVGWSHGGMIALMNIFDHPDDYQVAFAGVPVSDLIARMGYSDDEYRREFAADYHLGQTAQQNVNEYRRRSPAWNAAKLRTPLLIHTNTNDDDVFVLEVEHLIQALKAEDKSFEYEIFKDAPGGHSFDRIDTRLARQTRVKIYQFLARYLNPPRPIRTLEELDRAAYRWEP
ncbi:MAG TPA: alpha/beta fold hydrolase [Acidobacteriota bacterium]|mgnify:FL=1|nr:S9 family peptidase [Acidobacteriota bacterium]HOT00865.1 alpha/beta fold hydrolase [Acidobacteriota bacterium]HQF87377.1 alpha/beta fold hydrolase [Acidobacteriota bacterium]HQG91951.1 alpha/beta fold hydrolase [Acidobacteriota bacterium]HQK87441.1 alpha/beta fold hydrolase [Acidobacteriota bacterium]